MAWKRKKLVRTGNGPPITADRFLCYITKALVLDLLQDLDTPFRNR